MFSTNPNDINFKRDNSVGSNFAMLAVVSVSHRRRSNHEATSVLLHSQNTVVQRLSSGHTVQHRC